jgi:Fe-S cluster biogenesis protein NfuA
MDTMMPKIAEIEYTPNPNVARFILKEPVASGFPRRFLDLGTAMENSTAKALFDIGHIESVVMADKWLVVTKDDSAAWDELMPRLAPIVREAPAVLPSGDAQGISLGEGAQGDQLLQKVFLALKEKIYPYMAADGGGLEVVSRDGKQVTIHYTGACQNCPAGMVGTLMAIEGVLKADVDPDISIVTV